MRIVIAGVQSGVGKTTITVGLISALRRRGLAVQPFKVGPDYIDPTYHTLAAGRPCRNLDTWMIPGERLGTLFEHHAQSADIAIIEGAMGLFDGQNYLDETGSTAQVARLIHAPVILVIDAGKMARSAAAVALGFQRFNPELDIAGFIVNNIAGESHGAGIASAIEQSTGGPVLGAIPRNQAIELPERHLGLVPTGEPGRWQDFIDHAAEHIALYVDIDRVMAIAARPSPESGIAPFAENAPAELHGQRREGDAHQPVIAVARDQAFSFIYEENLDLLRSSGARIVFFSPLNDSVLPNATCGLILSGGFPEIYAEKLSANQAMRQALQEAHRRGLPIYAECGGLMVLTRSIVDLDGSEHPMFGLLPGHSVMSKTLHMGYRLAKAVSDSWLMKRGEQVRGHEFHYSTWEDRPASIEPAYSLLPSSGQGEAWFEGACSGSLWASYVHLPFWAKPELAVRFVQACQNWSLSSKENIGKGRHK